ncbi:MAG: hypothetical protein JKY42_10375 [Flavobacteriales bacterium]|nr:hypothetical protein [Flavobacteriales bacterium]
MTNHWPYKYGNLIRNVLLTYTTLLLCTFSFGQKDFGVLAPDNGNHTKKCGECIDVINSKPAEVSWGIQEDEEHNIYFVMSDIQWFRKIFSKSTDGIAVDIVSKSQYACSADNDFSNSRVKKGKMLEPIYYKTFKKGAQINEQGYVFVKIGKLPSKYYDQKYELNMMIIKGGYLCYYQSFFDLPLSRWGLLDMGLYVDTISKNKASDTSKFTVETSKVFNKRMRFVIPFEKGKYDYSPEDIKPLYDSLNLTDYNITGITIKSFSSVEGTSETNLKLQQRRASTIVSALKSFQEVDMETKIICAENWVEFVADMNEAGQKEMAKLTKEEIKNKLNNEGKAKEFEYLLKKHRKAVVLLDMEKKTKYLTAAPDVIQSYYEKSLKEKILMRHEKYSK